MRGKLDTNIEGFQLLTGATLAEALVEAGMLTREEADAALARRAERRRAALATPSTGGAGQ